MSLIKRFIDITLSLIGLLILGPFMPIIWLLIKLDSRGPVFFLADRVGKDMTKFKMVKFRTMIETPIRVGESVSPQYDPRVTTFGRFLRRTKINELPQFINILKGEMTFVGPRPEAPDLAELYPEDSKKIFWVKPGLVSPATLLGRNEEEVYPPGVDVKKYYIEKILPPKLKIDNEYFQNSSIFKDLRLILGGVAATLTGMVGKRHIHDNRSQILLHFADVILIIGSYFIAHIIHSWQFLGRMDVIGLLPALPLIIFVRSICNIYFGMYSVLIRFISYPEILGILKSVTCGSILLALFASPCGMDEYAGIIAAIDWATLVLLLSGLRFGLRLHWEKTRRHEEAGQRKRILIYGAGDAGNAACRVFTSGKDWPYEVVGFIDDGPGKYGKTLNGRKVLGNRYHIKELTNLYRISELLISEANGDPRKVGEIMTICQEAGIKCRIFSPVEDVDPNGIRTLLSRSSELADMLHLNRFHADQNAVREMLTDKTIVLYGSGAALGLELCRKIMHLGCKRLIIVDRYESYLNELVAALSNGFHKESIVPVVDNTDQLDTLEEVFDNYRPNIVVHAGMRKYVPFLGLELGDIGRTNYLRSFNLASAAVKFHSESFLVISSLMAGKGGDPITDSLRVAEVSLGHFFKNSSTQLIVARICDVAENRGGIVSLLEEQIRNQGVVTLPSANAQTLLMSKHSAAEFILQTIVEAKKSSFHKRVFACDGASSILLIEILNKLAEHCGLKMGSDFVVNYADQSQLLYPCRPHPLLPSIPVYSRKVEAHREATEGKLWEENSVFRDFILSRSANSGRQDWKERTRQLIKFCEPDSFVTRL